MPHYFKITKITEDEYVEAVGEDLGIWCQAVDPVPGAVYVAMDDYEEEMSIDIDTLNEAFGGDYDAAWRS